VGRFIRVERYQWLTNDKNPTSAIFIDAYHYKDTSVMYNVRQETPLPQPHLNKYGDGLEVISKQNKAQWVRSPKGKIREKFDWMQNPQDQKYPPTSQHLWKTWAKMFYEWNDRFKLVAVHDRQTGKAWEIFDEVIA